MSGKGRAKRRQSYTIFVDGQVEALTYSLPLAHAMAKGFFHTYKSCIIKTGTPRKTLARYNYGHLQ